MSCGLLAPRSARKALARLNAACQRASLLRDNAHKRVAVVALLRQPVEHHPDHHDHDHDDARHDEQLQDKARAGGLDRRQSVVGGEIAREGGASWDMAGTRGRDRQ